MIGRSLIKFSHVLSHKNISVRQFKKLNPTSTLLVNYRGFRSPATNVGDTHHPDTEITDNSIGNNIRSSVDPKNAKKMDMESNFNKGQNTKENLKQDYKNVRENVKDNYRNVESEAKDSYKNVKDNVKDKYRNMESTAKNSYENVKDNAKDNYRDMKDNVKDNYRDMKDNVKDNYRDMKDNVKDNNKNNYRDMKNSYENVKDNVKDSYENVKDNVKDSYENTKEDVKGKAKNSFENMKENVNENYQNAKEKVKDTFNQFKDNYKKSDDTSQNVKQTAQNVKKTAEDKFNEKKEEVKDKYDKTKSKMKDKANEKTEEAKSKMGNMKDDTKSTMENMTEKTKESFENIKNEITGTYTMNDMLNQAKTNFENLLKLEDNSTKDALKDAKAIIFLSVVKSGLGISGVMGSGIMISRMNNKDEWSGPVAIGLTGISIGLNAGYEKADNIIIIRDEQTLKDLSKKRELKLSGDIAYVMGKTGHTTSYPLTTKENSNIPMVAYSTTKGAYISLSLQGEILKIKNDCNEEFYNNKVNIEDILNNKVDIPQSKEYKNLIKVVNNYFTGFSSDKNKRNTSKQSSQWQ